MARYNACDELIALPQSQERAAAFRFIVCLGFVSLFADMTYEGAHSVIGPLLKDLGASATLVGVIAGLAAAAALTRMATCVHKAVSSMSAPTRPIPIGSMPTGLIAER